MSVVAVVSEDEDNAAEVFETLNDRGIGLSTPDLLRNLLMRRAPEDARAEIIDLWREILDLGGDPQLRTFLRHYWLSYEGDVKTQSLYHEIKGAITTRDTPSLLFSRSLRQASVTYRDLINAVDEDDELAGTLADLNDLDANVVYPALLSAYDVGDKEQQKRIARALLVAFVRHNAIGGLESTQLEKAVFSIARGLRENHDFAAALQHLVEFSPNNDRFQASFAQASVPRRATARYLLRELELKLRTTEELDVAPPPRVHVEHIYPQQPEVGNRWNNHVAAVNRLGNLTLLSRRLNTGARNASFETKRQYYEQSELLMTIQLLPNNAWTFADVETRQAAQAELAPSIWAFPA